MKEVLQLIHIVDIKTIQEFMLVQILFNLIHITVTTRKVILMEIIKLIMELLLE